MCKNRICYRDVANVTFFCTVCGHVFYNNINESCLCAKIKISNSQKVDLNYICGFPELPKSGDKKSYENI